MSGVDIPVARPSLEGLAVGVSRAQRALNTALVLRDEDQRKLEQLEIRLHALDMEIYTRRAQLARAKLELAAAGGPPVQAAPEPMAARSPS